MAAIRKVEMSVRGQKSGAKTGAAMLSLLMLAACATPNGSLSTKGDLVFEQPEDLCSVVEPTPEMIAALQRRDDYADIIIALGRACPGRADLFGIGPTASVPSLTMVQEDGSRGIVTRAMPEDGRDVEHPDPPESDGGDVVVIDPPPELTPAIPPV